MPANLMSCTLVGIDLGATIDLVSQIR